MCPVSPMGIDLASLRRAQPLSPVCAGTKTAYPWSARSLPPLDLLSGPLPPIALRDNEPRNMPALQWSCLQHPGKKKTIGNDESFHVSRLANDAQLQHQTRGWFIRATLMFIKMVRDLGVLGLNNLLSFGEMAEENGSFFFLLKNVTSRGCCDMTLESYHAVKWEFVFREREDLNLCVHKHWTFLTVSGYDRKPIVLI